MIEQKTLESLIENAADLGMSHIHEALVELRWRRMQMAKLKKSNEQAKIQIRDMKSAVRSGGKVTDRWRAVMARLKF